MLKKTIYSICAMCTVRCPIMVEVGDGVVKHIWGNPHILGGQGLCPRGAAGKAFEYDDERPRYPLMRTGQRGSGQWKRVTWDEALDYLSGKLRSAMDAFGPESICLSDRGGPFADFQKTFMAAIGSPNHFTHNATCSNSLHNAHVSMTGLAGNAVSYDYTNCRYLVLYGRNLLESLGTKESSNVIDMIQSGGKMVYLDVRWNYTAAKASEFHIINPGTDYAFNLALIHTIVKEELYDPYCVQACVTGIEQLQKFVCPYTPQWAEKETGIPAASIERIARQAAAAKPSVIFHPGWMTARYENDFYLRRSIYTLNALMGNYAAKGGIIINKTAAELGVKINTLPGFVASSAAGFVAGLKPKAGARRFDGERFDGCGTRYPHLGSRWGLAQALPDAIESASPYPIKAYIAMRHDPLTSCPDPMAFKKALNKLDLLVSIDVNYSETGWFSDLILPESTYLERTDYVIVKSGAKPYLTLRRQAVEPRFDSRPRSYIFKTLADRLGAGHFFPYEDAEDLVKWQLSGTGYTIGDFDATGFIPLSGAFGHNDDKDGRQLPLPQFKTPSGKIEIISQSLEKQGIPSFAPYKSPPLVPENTYRLVTGKTAVHTQGRTTANNPLLHEITPENHLWINTGEAGKLGIGMGDLVELSPIDTHGDDITDDTSGDGTRENGMPYVVEKIKAVLTDFIHPEVVFMLHGFGDTVPLRCRSYGKGASDVRLQKGLLKVSIGGNCPLTECIVSVKRAKDEHPPEEDLS